MPKPIGLANLGNTCFLNSCLQILFQIPELAKLKHNPINTVPSACLVDEWHTLNGLLHANANANANANPSPGFISPARFVQAVRGVAAHTGNPRFTGFDQNDASEFLYFLLNGWHDACKRPVRMEISGAVNSEKDKMAVMCYGKLKQTYEKEYSEIMQLFFGIATNKIIPGTPNEENTSAELFSLLHLPLTAECNDLVSCIREYTKASQVELNGVPNTKQTTFWNTPKYLFVVLGRFSGDGMRKDGREVSIPMRLDMTEFVSAYNPQKYKYELMGAILHMGSIFGGHYVCVVKSGEDWYSCNDTCIIKEAGFEDKLGHPNMTRGVYVAIYVKGTT